MPKANIDDRDPRGPETPQSLTAVKPERQTAAGKRIRQGGHSLGAEDHPRAIGAQRAQGNARSELVSDSAWHGIGVWSSESSDEMKPAGSTLPSEDAHGVSDHLRICLAQTGACEEIGRLIHDDEHRPDRHDAVSHRPPMIAPCRREDLLSRGKIGGQLAQGCRSLGQSRDFDLAPRWGEVEFFRVNDNCPPTPAKWH